FGGLFSAYVVFYSRSAGLGRGLLFAILLCALLVANELADHRLRGASVRLQLFFLVVTSYVLLVVPVFTGMMIGLLPAGLLAGGAVACVLVATRPPRTGEDARELLVAPLLWSGGLLVALLGLQQGGLIPAVPLSLRDAGAFHDLRRDADGWHLTYEDPGPLRPWRRHDAVVHWQDGQRIWLFTAVFAPTGLALDVVHHWQRWDDEQGWVTTDQVPYRLEGGREGGFRGYTYKDHASPGAWRVLVETPGGLAIGRVRFDVVPGDSGAMLERIY
ncbi:MAG: DUF2914 domain-containing protein, partial [Myxococcales bacterium]|nr:DUF2914 domain-containing protein [Myxococcales bacterium]